MRKKITIAVEGEGPERLLARLARHYLAEPCGCRCCLDLRFLLGVPEPAPRGKERKRARRP